MNWQPIETAPMDGTTVLTYCNYVDAENGPFAVLKYQFGWVDSGCGCVGDPTHWMFLPEPPMSEI